MLKNFRKKATLLIISLILGGCVNTYHFQRSQINPIEHRIKTILLVVDYTEIKDDIGKLMDYDIQKNIEHMEYAESAIRNLLTDKNYSIDKKTLRGSGMGLPIVIDFELYENDIKQNALIHPPFLMESIDLTEHQIQTLEYTLIELDNRYAQIPVNKNTQNTLESIRLRGLTEQLNLPNETAILFVHYFRPRISAVKAIGMSLISGTVSAGTSGNHIMLATATTQNQTFSNAFLIHVGSGRLLWKNHTNRVNLSAEGNAHLFKGLPSPLTNH